MRYSKDLVAQWNQVVKPGEVAEMAREAGFGQRLRKLIPRRVFWGVLLGFGVAPRRTLAGLARFISHISGISLSRQALHQRLSARAADFFRRCFVRLTGRVVETIHEPLPGKLAIYKDCALLDSTVLALANRLARLFPACRTNVQKAALKIHARVSLTQQEVEAVLITGERVSDGKAVSLGQWVKGRLLLFDLGYLDYGFLKAIREAGGAFCSRLKTTSNAIITSIREGCSKGEIGGTLNRPIYRGPLVDLDAQFGRGEGTLVARVVGLWDSNIQDYHWFATSLDPGQFTGSEVGQIYRLRWQIELLFKEWKSLLRLADLPSGNENIVMCLLYATLCVSLLSRLMLWLAARRNRVPWFEMSTPIAVSVLKDYAFILAKQALSGRAANLRALLDQIFESLALHGHQPHNTNAIMAFAATGG
jgi:putative transposase